MIKEFLVSLLHYFVNTTTGLTISAAIYLSASGRDVGNGMIWQILLCAFVTALPTAIFLCIDPSDVRLSFALWVVHFILMFFITLGLIIKFEWCELTPLTFFVILLAVGGIYFFVGMVHYLVDRKHTAVLNQQLKKRYEKKQQNMN